MRAKMRTKLRSRTGETIAETLIALLISALALTMLAGAISTAASLVMKSNRQMALYYENDNLVATQSETGAPTTVMIGEQEYTVSYYTNNAFAGTPVVSYKTDTTT